MVRVSSLGVPSVCPQPQREKRKERGEKRKLINKAPVEGASGGDKNYESRRSPRRRMRSAGGRGCAARCAGSGGDWCGGLSVRATPRPAAAVPAPGSARGARRSALGARTGTHTGTGTRTRDPQPVPPPNGTGTARPGSGTGTARPGTGPGIAGPARLARYRAATGPTMMKFRFRRQGADPHRDRLRHDLFAFSKVCPGRGERRRRTPEGWGPQGVTGSVGPSPGSGVRAVPPVAQAPVAPGRDAAPGRGAVRGVPPPGDRGAAPGVRPQCGATHRDPRLPAEQV